MPYLNGYYGRVTGMWCSPYPVAEESKNNKAVAARMPKATIKPSVLKHMEDPPPAIVGEAMVFHSTYDLRTVLGVGSVAMQPWSRYPYL